MASTEKQMEQMLKAVEADPTWKFTYEQEVATKRVDVTNTMCWTFRLAPVEGGDFFAWAMNLDTERYRGSFNDCTWWLDLRVKQAELDRSKAAELVQFAADHRHWRFVDTGDGKHYAARTFEYTDGARLLLSVGPHFARRRRPRFTAQLNAAFAAGPEHQRDFDTIGEVAGWIKPWQKALDLPLRLNGCTRGVEARDMCRQLSAEQLAKLAHVLDIHAVSRGGIISELVSRYAPTARD